MKCVDLENKLNLLLDEEANILQIQELETHLSKCQNCRDEADLWKKTQSLLKDQPQVLPNNSFDNRMIMAIQNHPKFQPKQSWFASIFNISKPQVAFAVALFALGIGLSFLLGRMSVSPLPQNINMVETKELEPRIIEKIVEAEPKVVTEVKYVTKYVEVPTVKTKIVEKVVYKNDKNESLQKENLANNSSKTEDTEIAKQFNLKDLQPVKDVNYRIIRKGENNE